MGAYIDAHTHLSDPRIGERAGALIADARRAGISGWLQGGIDPEDWKRQLEFASREEGIFPVFGVHPWWAAGAADAEVDRALECLEQELLRPGRALVAIGEVGLDHASRFPADTHARQLRAFERQLGLAARHRLPLVLHVVHAHGSALELLERFRGRFPGGLVHSFSKGPEMAERYADLGLLISVSGAVTRKGFESLKRAVVRIPDDSLVLETDCPDQPLGGREREALNPPASLIQVAEEVARLRGRGTGTDLLERSTANLRRVFGLKP